MRLAPMLTTVLVLAACGVDPSATPELVVDEGKTDLVFRITQHVRRADGGQVLAATAMHAEKPVGFELELGPWQENPPGFVNMTTWQCDAELRSQGAPSDELVQVLDGLYATRHGADRMRSTVLFQGFAPWRDPRLPGTSKFFLILPAGEDGMEHSAGVRIEIDLERARLHLREKDPRFRPLVVDALAGST
jgi:hypothetical protein